MSTPHFATIMKFFYEFTEKFRFIIYLEYNFFVTVNIVNINCAVKHLLVFCRSRTHTVTLEIKKNVAVSKVTVLLQFLKK